jgi:glycine/serine hydroxymethyltransferase
MKVEDMEIIAEIIYEILQAPDDMSMLELQKEKSLALCGRFPLPY